MQYVSSIMYRSPRRVIPTVVLTIFVDHEKCNRSRIQQRRCCVLWTFIARLPLGGQREC